MIDETYIDKEFFRIGLLYRFNKPEATPINDNFIVKEEKESKEEKIENAYIVGENKKWINYGPNPSFQSLKKNESLKIGNSTITITDPYGIRAWKNNHHSTGIDFVTNDGNAVALKDGEIVDISLEGDGSVTDTKKSSAGYYVKVKHTDGSYGQYMHLDPINDTQKKELLNKKIKRGDKIWGYTKGSGSMTGKHVKFRLYGQEPKVNIDPSQAFRGEDYVFIPDAYGNNILNR